MDDQRMPNPEEMDEREVRRFLAGLLSRLDPEEEYNARHRQDYQEHPSFREPNPGVFAEGRSVRTSCYSCARNFEERVTPMEPRPTCSSLRVRAL